MSAPERWRPVPGWEGRYEVSDHGAVRSLRRRDRYTDRLRATPLLMRPCLRSDGYMRVSLAHDHHVGVHRLVLAAFVGPRPPSYHGAHLNGQRADNRLENLAWLTPAENERDKIAHGTVATADRNGARTHPERLARGERHGSAKLTAEQVTAIREAVARGEMLLALAARFGVDRSTVGLVAARRTWTHLP